MDVVPSIYYFDCDRLIFKEFFGENEDNQENEQENAPENEVPELKCLEDMVNIDSDIYEILPIDPLGNKIDQSRQEKHYSYVTDEHLINEGLELLETLYSHPIERDLPEYVVVEEGQTQNPFTVGKTRERQKNDDDDVIFVKEYKLGRTAKGDATSTATAPGPRRNPHRKARQNSKVLTRDLVYDDDYDVLESSSDDDILSETLKKSARSTPSQAAKEYKRWPVNGLHERPEYNDSTKKLEKFDYTIRQIKNSVPLKKSSPKFSRRIIKKRKYFARRKIAPKPTAQQKVPICELKEVVESTLQDVKEYLKTVQKYNKLIADKRGKCKKETEEFEECNKENVNIKNSFQTNAENVGESKTSDFPVDNENNLIKGLELLRNQMTLCQVVNANEHDEILKCLE